MNLNCNQPILLLCLHVFRTVEADLRKGNTENLKPWKKGQSGNPGGRPKIAEDLKAVKELSNEEVKRLISKYFRTSYEEIQLMLQDTSRPAIELAFASAINKAIAQGDVTRILPLLERLIGKVKEEPAELNVNLQQISTVELIQLGRQAIEVLEGETIGELAASHSLPRD